MKKFYFMLITMIVMSVGMAAAQHHTDGIYFMDGWSTRLSVGAVSPLKHTFDFANHGLKNERFEWGLEVDKMVTPVVGFGVKGNAAVNTTGAKTAFDESRVTGLVKLNIANGLMGYQGKPRHFETVANAGISWCHYYDNKIDPNFLAYNVGLDFNWYLNQSRSWMFTINPNISWDMYRTYDVSMNVNRGHFALDMGLTYNFMNHTTKHYFTNCDKVFTGEEYDALNNSYIKAVNDRDELAARLRKCETTPKVVEKIVRVESTDDVIVGFGYDSSDISAYEPILRRVAEKAKTSKTQINVVGYSSSEGNVDYNYDLSLERANIVADKLMELGVSKNQINTIGMGSTEQFGSDYALNRVVLIKTAK